MREGFISGGWGREKVGTSIVGTFGLWEGVSHIFEIFKWMCGETSTGGSSAGRQIKGWGGGSGRWCGHVTYCRMVRELCNMHTGSKYL